MLVLRSIAFNAAYYLNLILWMIAALPSMLLPRHVLLTIVKLWVRSNLFLLRTIAGIRCEFRGVENIPDGGVIIASKHQSVWETFALFHVLADPCYILKRELMWIPVFGWYAAKQRMVPVNRGARSKAMKDMNAAAAVAVAEGRQIAIFPEGTRRPPGAEPAYKFGTTFLYSELGVPCVPIALNSGVHWPRRKFIRLPGTIVLDILPPIPPGLEKAAFAARLQDTIEDASTRLLTL